MWVRSDYNELLIAETAMLEPVRTNFEKCAIELPRAGSYMNCIMFKHEDKSRPWVLLGHGYGSGLAFYAKNLDALAAEFNVCAFDWLGFGGSGRPTYRGKCTTDAENFFIDALDEFVEVLKIEQFVLAGHSMGGYLAACYCLNPEYRKRVVGLILISPVGIPEKPAGWKPRISKAWWPLIYTAKLFNLTVMSFLRIAGPWGPSLVRRYRGAMAERFEGFYENHEDVVHNYAYHINVASPSGEVAMNHVLDFAFAFEPLCNRLDGLTGLPTLFMYGDVDWMDSKAGRAAADRLNELNREKGFDADVARVDHEIVRSAGHNIFCDNPADFDTLFISTANRMFATAPGASKPSSSSSSSSKSKSAKSK